MSKLKLFILLVAIIYAHPAQTQSLSAINILLLLDDDQKELFIAIQPKTSKSKGAFSNEAAITASLGETKNIRWDEPTRALDGSCLADSIDDYVVSIGASSGMYDYNLNIPRTDGRLNCTNSSRRDTFCDVDIIECHYQLTLRLD